MNYKDIVIYSDMDGTMLTDWSLGPVVPEQNLRSIRSFLQQGGSFAIASGRQYRDTLSFFPGITFNAPLVQGNGTLIYDCAGKRILEKTLLPQEYKRQCIELVQSLTDIWIVAANSESIYQVDLGDARDSTLFDLTREHISMDTFLNDEFLKVVYIAEKPERIEPLRKLAEALPAAELVHSSMSSPIYLETFDKRADKAAGIKRALELAGMQNKTLVCIGDFFNDEPMLRAADIAACPENAPQEIKELCSIITCDNNSGAVAELITRLAQI